MANQNFMLNYGDEFEQAIKYGYDDFIAISRQNLLSEGPISQYADNFNLNNIIILPTNGLSNNLTQEGDYSQSLIGQGYDPTNFSQDKLIIKPSFSVPILCVNDNIPAPYVFDIFDIARKSIYGDATEIVLRINYIAGGNIYFNSYDSFNLQLLINQLSAGTNLTLRIVDGVTLQNLSYYHTITYINSVDNYLTITPAPIISSNTYQYATILINQNYLSKVSRVLFVFITAGRLLSLFN